MADLSCRIQRNERQVALPGRLPIPGSIDTDSGLASRHDLLLTTARLGRLAAPGTARRLTVLATTHDADQGHIEGT